MAMGYAVVLKNGNDAALRIYPDIHIKGGNINLARAKELDPTVTDLTLENAGDLATKAGVTVPRQGRVRKQVHRTAAGARCVRERKGCRGEGVCRPQRRTKAALKAAARTPTRMTTGSWANQP